MPTRYAAHNVRFPIGSDALPDVSGPVAIFEGDAPGNYQMTIPPSAKGFSISLQGAQPGACLEVTRDSDVKGLGLCLYRESMPFLINFSQLGAPGEDWFVNLLKVGDVVNVTNPLWNPNNLAQPFFSFPPLDDSANILIHYYFH